MKIIGLLGGMSWESTQGYYKAINEGVKNALGGLHSAQIAMISVDFEPIEKLQHEGRWDDLANHLANAAKRVEAAGADFLLICTNTMHRVAPEIEKATSIPLVHIADATGEEATHRNIKTVGLLGTAFTMEQEFYKGKLKSQFDIDVITPDKNDRKSIHGIIYHELCMGRIEQKSKDIFLSIINSLSNKGAEAIILGCTEIGLLINQNDTPVPLLDTTAIHAAKAVEMADS